MAENDGGAASGEGGGGGGGESKTVDYATYQRVVQAKQGLEAQLAEYKGQVDSLTEKGASVDTLAEQLAQAKARADAAETKFARHVKISAKLGTTDPDVIAAVEWQHGRLPADGRKEDVGEWLDELKADPTKASSVLRPFLGGEGGGGSEGGGGEGGKKKPRDTGGGGGQGGQPPGGKSQFSKEQIRAAREHAVKTGDWSRYKEMRKAWTP